MDMANFTGQMVSIIRGTMWKMSSKVKENLDGIMGTFFKAVLWMDWKKEKVS